MRNWETAFGLWAAPPSPTEQKRCERTIQEIRNAIVKSPKIQNRKILVFTQGSFRNRVNVRQDSDVDVGVMLYDCFLDRYPSGKTRADFGNIPGQYPFRQFKDELEEALVAYFGQGAVTRGNKAFDIKASSYHVEADVVPLYEFRQYWDNGTFRAGVAVRPDNGGQIENYPERLVDYWPNTPLHYENGVSKNQATRRRYKSVVRILKKLRNEMEDNGNVSAKGIPGYLLECLAWNSPNNCFDGTTWDIRVQRVLSYLSAQTNQDSRCSQWCEVDGIKYLFHKSQPWTRSAANSFINSAWHYVGIR